VLALDDCRFSFRQAKVLVVGVVFRGGFWLENVMNTFISVDGSDATTKISKMVTRSAYLQQLKVILLNGITVGGFNVVDIKELNHQTGIPVLVINRKNPQMPLIYSALKNLSDFEKKWASILDAGEVYPIKTKSGKQTLYIQVAGMTKETGQEIIGLTSTISNMPEALRVAHLIASGISLYTTHYFNN